MDMNLLQHPGTFGEHHGTFIEPFALFIEHWKGLFMEPCRTLCGFICPYGKPKSLEISMSVSEKMPNNVVMSLIVQVIDKNIADDRPL